MTRRERPQNFTIKVNTDTTYNRLDNAEITGDITATEQFTYQSQANNGLLMGVKLSAAGFTASDIFRLVNERFIDYISLIDFINTIDTINTIGNIANIQNIQNIQSIPAFISSANLIKNGSFSTQNLSGWFTQVLGTAKVSYDPTNTLNIFGAGAAKLSSPDNIHPAAIYQLQSPFTSTNIHTSFQAVSQNGVGTLKLIYFYTDGTNDQITVTPTQQLLYMPFPPTVYELDGTTPNKRLASVCLSALNDTVWVTNIQGINPAEGATTTTPPLMPFVETWNISLIAGVYYAQDQYGVSSYSNAVFDDVVNYVQTQVGTNGRIILDPNTNYQLTIAPMSFAGIGTDLAAPNTMIQLHGGGLSCIITQTVANAHGIVLSNGAHVDFRSFRLTMPDTNSGNGIYGVDTGAQSPESITASYIGDIYIHGCDVTHFGMYLKNEYDNDYGKITIGSMNGSGLCLEATDIGNGVGHVGNSDFKHISAYTALYPITFKCTTSGAWLNLITFSQGHYYTTGGVFHFQVANTGVIDQIICNGSDIEGQGATATQIFMDFAITGGTISNIEINGFMSLHAGQIGISALYPTGVQSGNISYGGWKFDLVLSNTNTALLLTDTLNQYGNINYYSQNEYHFRTSIFTAPILATQFNLAAGTNPKITWQSFDSGNHSVKNPHTVVAANVADGGTIAHGVGVLPTWVIVEGDGSSAVNIVTELASARTSTLCTIQIKTPAGLSGANQTVTLRAGYYSD